MNKCTNGSFAHRIPARPGCCQRQLNLPPLRMHSRRPHVAHRIGSRGFKAFMAEAQPLIAKAVRGQGCYPPASGRADTAPCPRIQFRPRPAPPLKKAVRLCANVHEILGADICHIRVTCHVGRKEQAMQTLKHRLELLRAAPQDPCFKLLGVYHRRQPVRRHPGAGSLMEARQLYTASRERGYRSYKNAV